MKKVLALSIAGACLLMFIGCSQSGNEAETAASPVVGIDAAMGYVGETVDELYTAIGYPDSSVYQDSCELADAQDGFLYYDGFTVVTLKTDKSETVRSVKEK